VTAQAEAPHAAQPPQAAEALAHDAGLFGAVTRTKADLKQVWTCKAPPPSEREASQIVGAAEFNRRPLFAQRRAIRPTGLEVSSPQDC
jgi:hypothetical protein